MFGKNVFQVFVVIEKNAKNQVKNLAMQKTLP
jgi:hypothetical protein